jgi:mycoredoxin
MFTLQPTRTRQAPEQSTVPVVVYGTSWCAQSQKVCRYLDRLGIPFQFRDMDEDPEATRRVQWWTGGYASHPTVQVGGLVLVEPSLNELDWALSKNGLI